MSPDPERTRGHVRVGTPPTGARLAAHGREAVRATLLEAAREEGRREGTRAMAVRLDEVLTRLEALEQDGRAELARAAAELGVEIARTLLRRHIAEGDYDLERIVRETLEASGVGRAPCVVHLNPLDLASLSGVRFRSGTNFEADEGVARGDVHVETPQGLLVRDLEASLEAIRKRLREDAA